MPHTAQPEQTLNPPLRVVVVWIDWYAYHVARFRGLMETPELAGRVAGIELVGGIGVHAGLQFREPLPADLQVTTLLPEAGWRDVRQSDVARRLWTLLTQLDPEAVLVPGYYTLPGLAAALWARMHGRRSVLMTESTAYDHPRQGMKEWAKGLLLRALFDQAVTGGAAHVSYLGQLGFPQDRVAGCYDVVDHHGIEQRTQQLKANSTPSDFSLPNERYFLYVGRLAEEKNVGLLVRAWTAYRTAGGAWPLVLVGDGPSAESLKALAEASGHASNIHFAGHRGSQDLPPFYAFAGCFVLPSLREPWGLVVNEAMAASLPVLVSNRCGAAEDLVRDGENGFTFSPENEAELTGLMNKVSTLPDEQLREMGARSNEIAAAYTPQAFGLEIARLLGVAV